MSEGYTHVVDTNGKFNGALVFTFFFFLRPLLCRAVIQYDLSNNIMH